MECDRFVTLENEEYDGRAALSQNDFENRPAVISREKFHFCSRTFAVIRVKRKLPHANGPNAREYPQMLQVPMRQWKRLDPAGRLLRKTGCEAARRTRLSVLPSIGLRNAADKSVRLLFFNSQPEQLKLKRSRAS
jgi:hypothetical protein